MIAKIYPDNHPDLVAKRDPFHPVRYFDIRKLTPRECYRLMGVPELRIDVLMSTEKRPYLAFVGVDDNLAAFGLEPSATAKEVKEAYTEAIDGCDDYERETTVKIAAGFQHPDTRPTTDADGEPIYYAYDTEEEFNALVEDWKEELTANTTLREQYKSHYAAITAAETTELFGDVQIISNSNHYKLAGNSIVCDVLMYIYEEMFYPTNRRLQGEQPDMFALPQFSIHRDWQSDPLRLVTLCSGYDSQAIAFDMLRERYSDFRYNIVAWAEYDPESKRTITEQPAVVAHNLLFPEASALNRGDMTAADWSDLANADIDFLTYSTPCQSISQAGKRAGIKKGSGTRSAVLWSTEEAVKAMRPKILLQENVRALINSVNLPDFREWCAILENQGYVNFLAPSFPTLWGETKRDRKTISGILNSKHYGVPQNRERVYMVSVRKDILGDTQYEFPRPFPLNQVIADILEEEVDSRYFLKPDSVIKFLTINETDTHAPIFYVVTDHKLTNEEIAAARAQAK